MTLSLLRLYEPLPEEIYRIFSAVFLRADYGYIEVRVTPDESWVWENTTTASDGDGRLTCRGGAELSRSRFETPAKAEHYFWEFLNDPDAGLLECIL